VEPSACGIGVSPTVKPNLLGSWSISYTFSGSVLKISKVLIISSLNSLGDTFYYHYQIILIILLIPKYLFVSNTWSGVKALITSHTILSLQIAFFNFHLIFYFVLLQLYLHKYLHQRFPV
jgi:hypothetical protein